MKRVAILGSTGSIGTQALDVIAAHPEDYAVVALAANSNITLLAAQASRFRPAMVSAGTKQLADQLSRILPYEARVAWGEDGLRAVAAESDSDIVVAATDGMTALTAVLAALARGRDVALSNKELAVAAGEPLFAQARRSGAKILPVDSEHSAIFQCIHGEDRGEVASVVLTASGGPFWDCSIEQMREVTPEQALRHPTWNMGPKNTLDSATLMNKGLEVIEAHRFFGFAPEQIEVVVHRQSIAHAFVVFCDGSVKAQLAWPDMRMPIGFALAYPKRLRSDDELSGGTGARRSHHKELELTRAAIGLGGKTASMTFEPVDHARFPAIRLAYRALEMGQTYPAVLSAANEKAGRAFLQGKIRFTDIGELVEKALDAHAASPATLESIAAADAFARTFVREQVGAVSHT